ncbi:hypothetical protein F5B20DRAFT_522096 [Whalleya microplaca]|nr:hypothetical protein F5B20DRAFT_522096 [Whalleya microplaca]
MAQDSPTVSTLASIAEREPQNLQLHTDNIRHLEFAGDDSIHHGLFKDSSFPKLEKLVLDASDSNDETSLKPYLQSSLKCLHFYGGPISDVFLETLQSSCPQLEELLIDNPRDQISPEGFLRFLESAKALKRLSIMFGMNRVVTDSVFIALATRPDLESLECQKPMTANLISEAIEQTRHSDGKTLFPQLQKLVCVGEFDGLIGLLPYLPQLIHLEARITRGSFLLGDVQEIVPDIGTYCPNLRVLSLEYTSPEEGYVSSPALVKLAQGHRQLERLEISGEHIEVDGFGTSEFASIVQALPCLNTLRLAFKCDWTEEALVEASQGCGTTLVECELRGSYDLLKLEERNIAFPQLRSLELEKLTSTSGAADELVTKAATITQLLKRIAPKLEYFNVKSGDSFADLVEENWKGRT